MKTEAMIRAVQQTLGIEVDGKAGPQTWGAIYRHIVRPQASATVAFTGPRDQANARSERMIATLLPHVRPYARALYFKARDNGIAINIISGTRTHAEQDALCKRPEFAAIYARSACHLGDLTISQLADSSRLANADKAAFSKVRKESQDIGRKAAAAYRAFGGDRGRRVAAAFDRAEVMAERNGVDLYQGHITWGEYSQRRREVNQVYRDDFRRIHNQPR